MYPLKMVIFHAYVRLPEGKSSMTIFITTYHHYNHYSPYNMVNNDSSGDEYGD